MDEDAKKKLSDAVKQLEKSRRDIVKQRDALKAGNDILNMGNLLNGMISRVESILVDHIRSMVCMADQAEKECSVNVQNNGRILLDFPDDTSFEAALNKGRSVTGKTVRFTVKAVLPETCFGYNVGAGQHLNFVSLMNRGMSAGEVVCARILDAVNALDAWFVTYLIEDSEQIVESVQSVNQTRDSKDTVETTAAGMQSKNTETAIPRPSVNGDYVAWAKELEKNIQVMDKTFRHFGLAVGSISCCVEEFADRGPDLSVSADISSTDGLIVLRGMLLKLNLYDSEGELLGIQEQELEQSVFENSGVFTFRFSDCRRLKVITKGRLYVSRQ